MNSAYDLALSIETPDGRIKRWGPDEGSVGDIPRGLTFSTADPGGFKDASLSLARLAGVESSDLALFNNVRIYGAGNRTRWEGRLQEKPSHSGEEDSVNPGAVGWAAHLDDDPSFSEIYIDCDLAGWGEPSLQRRVNVIGSTYPLAAQASAAFQDAGGAAPGLFFDFSGVTKVGGSNPGAELMYYGGGVDIGRLIYDFLGDGTTTWTETPTLSSDDIFTSSDSPKNLNGATAEGQEVAATAAGRKYAMVQSFYTGAFLGTMTNRHAYQNVKVMGNHGLPLAGAWPDVGLLGDDVVADIVARAAPLLNFTRGAEGSIPPATFPIPHLVFKKQVKGSDAILGTNAYFQRSWGVYEDRQFFWLPTTTFRKRWRIRRSRGHQVDLLGPQAADAMNGVVVTFTDFAGQVRTLAPPGASNVYGTSPLLADESPTNPVNMSGIPRKWGELQLNFKTDVPGAIQVAHEWLWDKLRNAQARGSVVVTGMVEDEYGVLYPCSEMRAGDSATVTDGDQIERRIVSTNYAHESVTNTCAMDASPHTIEAQQERMGVVLTGVTD